MDEFAKPASYLRILQQRAIYLFYLWFLKSHVVCMMYLIADYNKFQEAHYEPLMKIMYQG